MIGLVQCDVACSSFHGRTNFHPFHFRTRDRKRDTVRDTILTIIERMIESDRI